MTWTPDEYAWYDQLAEEAAEAVTQRHPHAQYLVDLLTRMYVSAQGAAAAQLVPPPIVSWDLTHHDTHFLRRLVIRPE